MWRSNLGFSLSAVIIKGSAFFQMSVSLTLPVPKSITRMPAALGYGVGVVYEYMKSETALGRLFTNAKGFFDQLRGQSDNRPAIIKEFEETKDRELTETTYDVDKYTPWACSLPWRGFAVEDSPSRLPNDPSCKREAQHPFTTNLPSNYLICPSRSLKFERCNYFCPSN